MMQLTSLLLFASALLLQADSSLAQMCCVCGSTTEECLRPLTTLGRASVKVDGTYGNTCARLTSVFQAQNNNPMMCQGLRNANPKWVQRCCGAALPDPNDYNWNAAPAPVTTLDTSLVSAFCSNPTDKAKSCFNPRCDICMSPTSVPSRPYDSIAALHIFENVDDHQFSARFGNKYMGRSCGQIFEWGKAGGIPTRLCYPLQLHIRNNGACGCNGSRRNLRGLEGEAKETVFEDTGFEEPISEEPISEEPLES